MSGVSVRAAVIDRLGAVQLFTGVVQGAGKLAQLTAGGASFQGTRGVFVLPLGLDGGPPDAVTGLFRQRLDRLVGVVLMTRNQGDALGDRAQDDLDPMIDAAIGAVVGWGPDEAVGVFALARGELLSVAAGLAQFQLTFTLQDQLRI